MTSVGRANLKDVAKEAGVSITTVSRHLNGQLSLPERTRDRIQEAVIALNYQPNPHARRLSLGRSDTIAIILPDISNPFFSTLAASVEHAAALHGSMVVLHATLNREDREVAALELANRNHVDGIIFASNHTPSERVSRMLNDAQKAVIIDENVPGADIPRVFCDNEQGGFLAGQHLAQMGHRRVAYISGGAHLMSTLERLAGLRRGLGCKSEQPEVQLFDGEHSTDSGRHLAEQFLSQRERQTALFVGSDELAIGVLEILQEHSVRVPADISIVSFDDVQALHLFRPAITAVRQPVRELGQKAIDILFEEEGITSTAVHYLPVSLSERASVAPPSYSKPSTNCATSMEKNHV